jgi:hypothetical protein
LLPVAISHRQGHLALPMPAAYVQQIAPHQPILGICVEVCIGLAIGRRTGDRPFAIELEVDGNQPGVGAGQSAQPPPAGTDRSLAEQIQTDGAHTEAIQPFHRIGQLLIGNQGAVTVQVSFVDADDPHRCASPGGGRSELHGQVVGEQIDPFGDAALAQAEQQTKGGGVGNQVPQDRTKTDAGTGEATGH